MQKQVMRSITASGCCQTTFTGGIPRQEMSMQGSLLANRTSSGVSPLTIKGRAAQTATQVRPFQNADMGWEHLLTQGIQQKAGLSVKGAPTVGTHKGPQQTSCQRGLKYHRITARGNTTGLQTCNCTLSADT